MDEVFFYGDESLLVSGIKRKKLSKGVLFDSKKIINQGGKLTLF